MKQKRGRPPAIGAGATQLIVELHRLTRCGGALIADALDSAGLDVRLPGSTRAPQIVRAHGLPESPRCVEGSYAVLHLLELRNSGRPAGQVALLWEPVTRVVSARYRRPIRPGREDAGPASFVTSFVSQRLRVLNDFLGSPIRTVVVTKVSDSSWFDDRDPWPDQKRTVRRAFAPEPEFVDDRPTPGYAPIDIDGMFESSPRVGVADLANGYNCPRMPLLRLVKRDGKLDLRPPSPTPAERIRRMTGRDRSVIARDLTYRRHG